MRSFLTRNLTPYITPRLFCCSSRFLDLYISNSCQMLRPYVTAIKSDSPFGTVKTYKYSDIMKLINTSSSAQALIDVRERNELYHYGTIPTSLNIPLSLYPDALIMATAEFREKFRFERPNKDVELIFFCQAGLRSSQAADLALKAGWSRVGNYSGSWIDWKINNGKMQIVAPPKTDE